MGWKSSRELMKTGKRAQGELMRCEDWAGPQERGSRISSLGRPGMVRGGWKGAEEPQDGGQASSDWGSILESGSRSPWLVIRNIWWLQKWLGGKEPAYQAGDEGSILGWGRSPGEGNGNLLQYSCLENLVDRGAWQATVHGVTKSQTRLSN